MKISCILKATACRLNGQGSTNKLHVWCFTSHLQGIILSSFLWINTAVFMVPKNS